MAKFVDRLRKFWYFRIANPVILKGEKGGFRWVFRRYWLDIRTISGNWSLRVTAGEYPYGYLLAGAVKGSDENVHGFAATLYLASMSLTQDQKLVNDVQNALKRADKRIVEKGNIEESERQDEIALEAVKREQEFVEMPKKERRKAEREINGRFKKAVRDAEKRGE